MYSLEELLTLRYNNKEEERVERLLCLDPGGSTGWCLFENGKLTQTGEIRTSEEKGGTNGAACLLFYEELHSLIDCCRPTQVVCENYRVYSHKLERHTFSEVPTLRLIGAIDLMCYYRKIPIFYQMAVNHKPFVTDAKLKAWGMYKISSRHARDAVRMGVYYMLVSSKK